MSSIIANRLSPFTPFTARGVLSSSVNPIDCASRRAGSIVSTTVRRPASAPSSASAAAVVLFPPPPLPQVTTTRVSGSRTSAAASSGWREASLTPSLRSGGGALHPWFARKLRSRGASPEPGGEILQFADLDGRVEIRQRDARQRQCVEAGLVPLLDELALGVLVHLLREGRRLLASQTRLLQAGSEPGDVDAAVGADLPGLDEPRAGTVHDDRAEPELQPLQLGHGVDRLLDRHLLEQCDDVHGGSGSVQQLDDADALVGDRTDLRQLLDLAGGVEEPADPPGGWRVQDDGVVTGVAVLIDADDRLLHLPGQQDVP